MESKPETATRLPQLDALTSIRFFFAWMVLVGHFVGHFLDVFGELPGFVYQMAPTAVSWFFILSGFIIVYNYPKLATNPARHRFIISRIARLWPVHVVTLIAAVFIVGRGKPLWFLSQLTLTHTWLADANVAQAYNGAAWSISDEMFFYLVYVALMFPRRWMQVLAVVLPVTAGVALPFFDGCFVPAHGPYSAANSAACSAALFQFPPARLIEFLAGVALCRVRPRVPQAIGLLMAVVVLAYVLRSLPGVNQGFWPLFWRQVAIIAGGSALICSLSRDGWLSRMLSVRPLVVGGEISYSTYMSHQLVMVAIFPIVAGWSLQRQFCLISGIVIGISAILFYVIEKPARDAVKQWLSRPDSERRKSLTHNI